MKREMRVALNEAFMHGEQSGIVKRNVVIVDCLWIHTLIGSVPPKPWHVVYNKFIVIFLSIKQIININ